ncbi:shikimate kinase [Maliponia aquimaris]|uniref:Shikimate kinase n=1 Tax=Maliponia aquimaris TaxID=1673631 RepID=A0A238JYN4_9RHOB|nr:shikimate kinase [Maliponia aquimaris]SMX35770.1 Shikimate kinase [Maliponia aquimaris]
MADAAVHKGLILHKTIVFVGMMGAGKTAVGRTLAAQLGVVFRDSDHEIEEAANRTIAEIFSRDGEAFFRRKESQVIERLLEGEPGVLSTGGGAFVSEANRAMISRMGVSVWLNADLELLWERVRHKDTRPLLRTPDPKGTLRALYEARVPVYAKADIEVVSVPGLSLDQMARRVSQALLARRPDVLEKVE